MFGSLAAEQWIYQKLALVEALEQLVGEQIHAVYAPQGTVAPFAVFYRTGAEDSTPIGVGIEVGMQSFVYTVAIVAEGSDKFAILAAATAAHQALHGQQADHLLIDEEETDYGTFHITCHRIGELPNDDIATPDDGVEYVTLGGLYELEVTAAG
jgi:hypothetical protein